MSIREMKYNVKKMNNELFHLDKIIKKQLNDYRYFEEAKRTALEALNFDEAKRLGKISTIHYNNASHLTDAHIRICQYRNELGKEIQRARQEQWEIDEMHRRAEKRRQEKQKEQESKRRRNGWIIIKGTDVC